MNIRTCIVLLLEKIKSSCRFPFQGKMILIFLSMQATFLLPQAHARDLNISVSVAALGLSESDRLLMQTLQEQLTEFVNDRDWTPYTFQLAERIEGSISLTITERQGDEFRGTLMVQSRRPVFHTNYHSPVFNHMDRDVAFRYIANQPLEFADETFTSNLTSLIAFYTYIIIGLDFDTFAPLKGTEFFQKAQSIVNQAQNTPESGWRSFESPRNRFWLAENLMNPAFRPIRLALHGYHRLGFDRLAQNIEAGRAEVLKALEQMQVVNRERPGSFIIPVIMNAKSDEIISLFGQASSVDKERVLRILNELDPANSAKHQALRQ